MSDSERRKDPTSSELAAVFSAAFEQCPTAFLLAALDGRILYVNRQFSKLTGYAPEEVVGRNPRILQSGYTSPDFYEVMWETIAAGKEFRGEIQNRRKNGELYWENLTISPVRDASGTVCALLAMAEDITERKQLREGLHESLMRLTDTNARLEHFASIVSHDLQGPLGNVAAAVDFLAENYSSLFDDDANKILAVAQSSVLRATTLVRELLSYSRASKRNWEPAPVNVKEFMPRLVDSLEREIAVSGAHIEWSELPIVLGNATLLRELFYNLISNAIKYRGARLPVVHLSGRREPHAAVITVSDNGMGIPPDELLKVFEPFTRGSNAESLPGTGLGLALCKHIMDLHHGEITVESTLDEGTTFSLFFPDR